MNVKITDQPKIGIIQGAGTGKRLIEIFKDFLEKLVLQQKKTVVQFVDDEESPGCPYTYQSYQSLITMTDNDALKGKQVSIQEAVRLSNIMREWYNEGIRHVFRTSINAESLYLFRQYVEAVKVFGFNPITGLNLLCVRDQTQGYYANESYDYPSDKKIVFSSSFDKDKFQKIINFSNEYGRRYLGEKYSKWAIYKLHEYSSRIMGWIKEFDNEYIADQGEVGIYKLSTIINESRYQFGKSNEKILFLCGNEIGDLIYELLLVTGREKLEQYTQNYYLAEPFEGQFTEYQTVHGSADDIEGTDLIIPYATLRIAADLAEKVYQISDAKSRLEEAIRSAKRLRLSSTSQMLRHIYAQLKITYHD